MGGEIRAVKKMYKQWGLGVKARKRNKKEPEGRKGLGRKRMLKKKEQKRKHLKKKKKKGHHAEAIWLGQSSQGEERLEGQRQQQKRKTERRKYMIKAKYLPCQIGEKLTSPEKEKQGLKRMRKGISVEEKFRANSILSGSCNK